MLKGAVCIALDVGMIEVTFTAGGEGVLQVSNKVQVYEVEGKVPEDKASPVGVDSHWNDPNKVVLTVAGKKVTVLGAELKAAVDNVTNTGSYV